MTSPIQAIARVEVARLPELPEPVNVALFEGHCMQGPEIRGLADSYEPGCAQYTADQMRAYATEAIAAERAEVVRLLAVTDEYQAWIMYHAAGHDFYDFLSKINRAALATPTQGEPK